MAARQAVGDVNVAGGECVAGDVAFEVLGECRVLHVLTEATLLCAQVGAAARCWCGSAVDRGHALRQLPRVTVAGRGLARSHHRHHECHGHEHCYRLRHVLDLLVSFSSLRTVQERHERGSVEW
jgi:hypothetical protein